MPRNFIPVLIALFFTAAAAPVLAACPAEDLPRAVTEYEEVLWDRRGDEVRGRYGLYAERCNGGLYLVDLKGPQGLIRVNEGWWLEEFESAHWIKAGSSLAVTASYITGIGPTGTVPFRVRIVVARKGNSWAASEPEHLGAAAGAMRSDTVLPVEGAPVTRFQPVLSGRPQQGVWQAFTREEFDALDLSGPVDVDFAKERFVAKPVTLTSGSGKIKNVRVHKSASGYFISYETKYPPIGTTDIKVSVVYAVLPQDGLPVTFLERPSDFIEGYQMRLRAGVLGRGN